MKEIKYSSDIIHKHEYTICNNHHESSISMYDISMNNIASITHMKLRCDSTRKRYSLLRETAIAIDLHQLGRPERHVIYASFKNTYTATVLKNINILVRVQLHLVGRPFCHGNVGSEPPTTTAEGSTTDALGTVLHAVSEVLGFLVPT